MGKRSNFDRVERDYYPTPKAAVEPLFPFVKGVRYIEPCAGDGRLINHLHGVAECVESYDVEPQSVTIQRRDALIYTPIKEFDCFITNPPWDRGILHPLIDNLASIKPTWLLFDADWMHTKQSSNFMIYCRNIVSIGRVKWIEGSKMTGKDNCCWYLFDKSITFTVPVFHGRT